MRSSFVRSFAAVVFAAALVPPALGQDAAPDPVPDVIAGAATADDSIAEEWTPWTTGRYRITPGDVIEFTFPFVPELNQTVTVQPDGYVTLKELPDMRVQGRTLAQLKADVLAAYEPFVRDPVFSVTLKEFEKPYFVATGEVEKPGRYELRGPTTLTQALAIAGGATDGANIARVVLYRRYTDSGLEVKQIDVSRMYAKKELSEDLLLRPGDTIVVPKSVLGKLSPLLWFMRWYYW